MPFYDLYCASCGTEHNIRATIDDKTNSRIPCPDCGSTELKTLYRSAPAYIKSGGEPAPSCARSNVCGAACPHAGGY